MTALPSAVNSRNRKMTFVGLALVASLSLAGCAGGNSGSDSDASPVTAAPSSTLAPADTIPAPPPADSGVYERPSLKTDGVFSNEDGFSVAFGNKDTNQLSTPDGGVSRFKGSADEDIVSFTSYEKSGEKNWTLTLPEIKGGSKNEGLKMSLIELLRWEGKSYVVANQAANVTTSASGLEAGKSVTVYNTHVIDIETGKIVNTVTVERPSSSSASSDVFIPVSNNRNGANRPAFATVLVTEGASNNVATYRALHPLTGATLDEMQQGSDLVPFFAGGEFKNSEVTDLNSTFGGFKSTLLSNTFGDFALVRSGNEIEVGAYDKAENVHHSLIDFKTGATVASIDCKPVGNEHEGRVYHSANFRYVAFDGNFIFDTETGKSFCGAKTDTRSGLAVYAIDNDGNMFGKNDAGKLLKVSIADNSVTELYDVAGNDVPQSFTSKGLGVFPGSENTVLLPLKK